LKLLGVSALISEGKTTEEALRTLRPPLMFYRKDDFIRQLRVWNKDRIMSALSMLYECERDCKTTGMPQENIAGYCLLRISGAVKKFR
jgi:DNA polymerase-3 subunit delta